MNACFVNNTQTVPSRPNTSYESPFHSGLGLGSQQLPGLESWFCYLFIMWPCKVCIISVLNFLIIKMGMLGATTAQHC